MEQRAEKKLRRLTRRQAVALKAILEQVDKSVSLAMVSRMPGKEMGGIMSSLERKGYVQPIGRVGRSFNWEISDEEIKGAMQNDKKEIIKLLNKIIS